MASLNDLVKAVHKAHPSTRIDTKLLLAKVWEAQGLHLWIDQMDILRRNIISPPASVLRASQRVQQTQAKRLITEVTGEE